MSKSSRPVVGADLAAGDGELHQRAQQMQAVCMRMSLCARVPVEHGAHGLAGRRQRARLRRRHARSWSCRRRRRWWRSGSAAALDLEHALVAGLAAGGGIEHRAVEHDAAALVDGQHARRAVAQVGVGAVELLGHARSSSLRPGRSDAYILGDEHRAAARSATSHRARGRFFDFRNAGLNSLDW